MIELVDRIHVNAQHDSFFCGRPFRDMDHLAKLLFNRVAGVINGDIRFGIEFGKLAVKRREFTHQFCLDGCDAGEIGRTRVCVAKFLDKIQHYRLLIVQPLEVR